jgi:hypothetical protein
MAATSTGVGQAAGLAGIAEPESFGLGAGAFESFGATRFPGLDAETTQSILDDIGKL